MTVSPPRSPIASLRRLAGRLRRRIAWTTGSVADSAEARLVAAHFDVAYYLGRNPDVAASGVDPLAHFMAYGWREGRDPSPDFSLTDYGELYPDVVEAGGNPFVHYLQTGRAEGRVARRRLGYRHDILARLLPMSQRTAPPKGRRIGPSAPQDLARALAASRSGFADLHLTFSHDNYATSVGGVQLCVQREDRALAGRGVDHLHLFPAEAFPMVRTGAGAGLLGLIWNGALVGHFEPGAVADALAAAPKGARSLAIHSLLGHSSPDVIAIAQAAGARSGFFWIHDFASLCAGFHLTRNDVADCAAPPPDSGACTVCVYGPHRALHVAEHRRLFEALDLTVVAPSQSALDTWRASADLPRAGELVRPHAALGATRPGPEPQAGPLRVAFMGTATPHKGWPVFQDLALRFRDDPRYAFVQLGRRGVQELQVEFHEITVGADAPDAMRRALEDLAIDVAVIWPLCRETFSFTAFEAAAAGAAVLTHPDSGNVAAMVAEGGHGRVLADEDALMALFESGEAVELSRAARKPLLRELEFGDLSAGLRAAPGAGPAS
ncbi:MAG TPA: hypothetical protein VFW47_02440 [Phenylobacterium sp.]|nr:hypothetical protein [Phenylobacterium sp.]